MFERVIRAFVENHFIYASDSFRPLIEELGYRYETKRLAPWGRDELFIVRTEPTAEQPKPQAE